MKVIAAFFSAFIFIALIVLLITSLADIPEEALRLRLIPKLSDPLLILLSSVVGLFFLGTLAGAAGFLVSRRKSGAARKQTRKDLGFFHVIVFIVVSTTLILFILALIISLIDYPEEDELKGQGEGEETDEAREDEQQGETWENGSRGPRGVPDLERRNRIVRFLVISAGAVLFIIILLFSVRLFRSPIPEASEERKAEKLRRELAKAARISLDDIRNNSDFRAAVIACYADGGGSEQARFQTPAPADTA
jgi:amino acid transporter